MTIGIADVLSHIGSHAKKLGLFRTVMLHEPKSAPSSGAVAIWVQSVEPVPDRSGLDKVSILLTVNIRIYANMLQEPQDAIDRDLLTAADLLLTEYAGDFDLGDENRTVDMFGSAGDLMRTELGYINQDGTLFRVCVITLPVLINDVWNEVA
ncbi:hypothetical protein ACFWHF_14450 [Streptomyces griseoincarnatus]